MAENIQDATFEILKNLQSTLVEFRTEVNQRLDTLEAGMRKDRRNAAGMIVMMRATAGDFDQRVSEVEERLARLEAARS
ncbi:hypothetical protein [Enterovirga sp. CN4-39]|uniref:hypothetical protein n=1 Tax=Enterovirga sp. CN4-39 TaxID=3400910 RepID=UPI003C07CAA3